MVAASCGQAAGVEFEARWARLAAANIAHARRQGATGAAEVYHGDARQLQAVLPGRLAGRVALVVTSPPYGASVHGQVRAEQRRGQGGGVRKYDNHYGRDPANLACHPSLALPALAASTPPVSSTMPASAATP